MEELPYKCAYEAKKFGAHTVGIKIEIYHSANPNLKAGAIQRALYDAAKAIEDEVDGEFYKNDPRTQANAQKEKADLIACFPQPIYVEEIPSEYSPAAWLRSFPWLIVTTSIGRIKIGWRKRVIEIDWSDTRVKTRAVTLFPDEDVTRNDQYIHAWGVEKAAEYIAKIMGAASDS